MDRSARRTPVRFHDPPALLSYSPDRKAEHAHALLTDCRGFLHADGYAGFADLYKPEPEPGVPRLTEVACWAHARRKIYDVHVETGSPAAREALERIARLFAIEADIRGRSPGERQQSDGDARRRCWPTSKPSSTRRSPRSA